MATNTTNYQYILPDVGGDDFAWGTMNNENWIKADAKFKSIDDRTISTNNGLTGGGNLSANRTIGLTGQALALHNHATNGFLVRTGDATYASRTLVAGDGINVTNGTGGAGNPTVAVDSTVVRNNSSQTIAGSITTTDGSITIRQASNAHLWYRNPSDNKARAVIYATPDRALVSQVYQADGTSAAAAYKFSTNGIFEAPSFQGDGSRLTGLDASAADRGTLPVARLPNTVALLNQNTHFTGNLSSTNSIAVRANHLGNAHYTFLTEDGNTTIAMIYANANSRILNLRTYDSAGNTKEAQLYPGGALRAQSFVGNGAIGTDQTWRDVSASRSGGTTYQNTTGRAIMVSVSRTGSGMTGFFVDGIRLAGSHNDIDVQVVVPNGSTYEVTGVFNYWAELR